MNKELIVSYQNAILKIAILKNGFLEEIYKFNENNTIVNIGDIYCAKVKKIKNELNSCFVNLSFQKDGFLHYQDLGKSFKNLTKFMNEVINKSIKTSNLSKFIFEEEINKNGQIHEILKPNDNIIVQIVKEPIANKGPRLTSEISITGRFIILNPFSNNIFVSKNIKCQQERIRLKKIVNNILPKGFGLIVRTVAEGKSILELNNDLCILLKKWHLLFINLQKNKIPNKILNEISIAQKILRDHFNDNYISIICDDINLSKEFENYLKIISPHKKNIVKYYNNPIPLFENYAIERNIKKSCGKYVNIPNFKGSYLIIENTEAMHVIDVNSGRISFSLKEKTQEQTALEINLCAATEIARQLRLRNLGGIIIIDFIDMNELCNKQKLYNHLKNEMFVDKIKHKILPLTKFGIMQITRQRISQNKIFDIYEVMPNNGIIEPPILFVEKIENEINKLLINDKQKIYLHIHPFIASFLKQGLLSIRFKWFFKFKKWINIIERDAYKYLEYSFYNEKNKKI